MLFRLPVWRGRVRPNCRDPMPLALVRSGFPLTRTLKSTRSDHFSDESFRIRDVQFNQPEIGIDPRTVDRRKRLVRHSIPAVGEILRQASFKAGGVTPVFDDLDHDIAAIRVAAAKDRRKPSASLSLPAKRSHLQAGRETFVQPAT